MMKTTLALDNYVVGGLDGIALARTFQELLEGGRFVEDELASLGCLVPPSTHAAACEEPAS